LETIFSILQKRNTFLVGEEDLEAIIAANSDILILRIISGGESLIWNVLIVQTVGGYVGECLNAILQSRYLS